ncbi:MAG TPA: transketolase C-terminal domain-containing protein [Chloroflexota bacterium]
MVTAARELTFTQALLEAIVLEMRRDPTIIMIGEDVAGGAGRTKSEPEGWFAARGRGLIAEFGPERIIDTPIAEMGFVGAGVGAAMTGLRPIVDLAFIDLIGVCYDQIANQAAKMHYMMGGKVRMPLVLRTSYGSRPGSTQTYGGGAAAQHSQTMYSVLAHISGLKVVVPSTPYNAKGLMISAIRDDGPVVVLENKFLGAGARGRVPEEAYTFPIGQAEVVRRGRDVTLCGIGRMTRMCLEAAAKLAAEGIEAEVVDVLTLAPLDEDTILESVAHTRRLVVVDEDTPTASMARDIAARVADKGFDNLDAPVKTVTAPEAPVPFAAALERHYAPTPDAIVATVQAQLGR